MSKVESTEENKRRHVDFTKAFVDAYQIHFSAPYRHQGPKDGSPLKAFLASAPDVTATQFGAIALQCWNGRDPWLNKIGSIAELTNKWNKAIVVYGKKSQAGQPEGVW